MSKSKNNKYDDYIDDEFVSISKIREEYKNRRRQKRLKAALKTKNISKLIEYEEHE